MAQQFISGRFKSFLDSGAMNVGGRLYTYASGTTTHKDAYTDATLTVPCTYTADGLGKLYIALNARGEAQVWIGAGTYTMVDQTSLGVTLDTTDGVTDSGQSATLALTTSLSSTTDLTLGAGLSGYSDSLAYAPPSVGASLRARGAVVTDKPYLADPAGIVSSRTGIQVAIDSGRDVHFTPGTFDARGATLNFQTPGQTIYLHGSTLKITQLNINADNVTFDGGGGEIRGPLKVGQLAAPAAVAQNLLVLVSAAEFSVGDSIWCSYGDNVSNFPLATPNAITAINGNTLTLTNNLSGTVGLPAGIWVGTFSFTALVGNNASKNLQFINLHMKRTQGYFLYSWRWNQPDFSSNIPTTYCYNVDFDEAGLDQFCAVKAKQVFEDCTFGISFDVAKQGFVYGDDAQIIGYRCKMARGNYDMDFLAISDAGRSTWFQGTSGKIAFTDSYFSGLNKLPGSAYFFENALHSICWNSGGANYDGTGGSPTAAHFVEFSFTRCRWENYTRSLFSTTVIADPQSSVLDRFSLDDCQIGTQLFQLKAVAGKTLTIKAFNISKSAVFSSSAAYELTLAQNTIFVCNIVQTTIKATGAIPELVSSRMVDSTIDNSPGFWINPTTECLDVTLTGGTRVAPRFTYAGFPVRGNFIIDSPTFAATPGDLSAFILLGADASSSNGQSCGATARSANGSVTYNLARASASTLAWARLTQGISGRFRGLTGDDWMIGSGAQVIGTSGSVVKTTYASASTLAAAAAAGAVSIVVASYGTAAIGDQLFIQLTDGTVHNTAIAAGWGGASTTIPVTDSLPSAAASGKGISFLRLVAL